MITARVVMLMIFTAGVLFVVPAVTASADNFDAINWYNKGVDLAEVGSYQDALAATDRSIEIQPNFSLAWTSKSGILVMLGNYSEALNASEKAIALQPNDGYAYCNKADALYGLGRYNEAVRAAEQALAISPGLQEAEKIRARAMGMSGSVPQGTAKSTPAGLLPVISGIVIGAGVFILVRGRD